MRARKRLYIYQGSSQALTIKVLTIKQRIREIIPNVFRGEKKQARYH